MLYRSSNLQVRQSGASVDGKASIVTFEAIGDRYGDAIERPFAEPLAEKLGISILHVIPDGPDWYQYDDMPDCLDALAPHLAENAFAYGSSMGGYAAIRFADRLGLDRAIAFAPQVSIRGVRVPFETRWRDHAARIRFLDDDPVQRRATAWIFVDPRHAEDMAHAEAILKDGPGRTVRVDFGGHTVIKTVLKMGVLVDILQAFLEGTENQTPFGARIDAASETCAPVLLNRARHTRGRSRLEFLERAHSLAPHDPRIDFQLGLEYLRLRRIDEAEPLLLARVRGGKQNPKFVAIYRKLCDQLGIPARLIEPADS